MDHTLRKGWEVCVPVAFLAVLPGWPMPYAADRAPRCLGKTHEESEQFSYFADC